LKSERENGVKIGKRNERASAVLDASDGERDRSLSRKAKSRAKRRPDRLRSTKVERKRAVAPPSKGIFRRETRRFRRSKTNFANENVAKIASNDEKNVFPRLFFDGLGLLKSSAVSLRTSKRFRSETAENSPFDGKPPNFETGEPEPND
jgi:hypothetical protein